MNNVQVDGTLDVEGQATFNNKDINVCGATVGIGVSTQKDNIVFGRNALKNVDTGGQNVAIGEDALRNVVSTYNNTAVGYKALSSTNSANSTAVGDESLRNATGDSNTALGMRSGYNVTTGIRNTFLGRSADFDSSANQYDNSTAIGYNAKINASQQIMMGTSSETVQVPGQLNVDDQATFNNKDINVRGATVGIGVSSQPNNVVFGRNALKNVTTAGLNVAIGEDALRNLVDQNNNTAVGYQALRDNTGQNSTAVGEESLRNVTSGNANSALGSTTGLNVTTGRRNTFLGHNADFDSSANQYEASTAIGYNAKINASDQIMMGTSNTTVEIPGTLSYQTWRQPIIFSCIVGRNTIAYPNNEQGYFLWEGHSYGINSVSYESTGVLTINFTQQPLNNNRYKPMLTGGINSNNDASAAIMFGVRIANQTDRGFAFNMINRDGNISDLADNSQGAVYVTVYYYP
jgi:hypothetical protein